MIVSRDSSECRATFHRLIEYVTAASPPTKLPGIPAVDTTFCSLWTGLFVFRWIHTHRVYLIFRLSDRPLPSFLFSYILLFHHFSSLTSSSPIISLLLHRPLPSFLFCHIAPSSHIICLLSHRSLPSLLACRIVLCHYFSSVTSFSAIPSRLSHRLLPLFLFCYVVLSYHFLSVTSSSATIPLLPYRPDITVLLL